MKGKIILFFLIFDFLFLISRYARAQEMKSENFAIQGGNFNMTSGNKSSTSFKLSDTVGQTSASIFTTKGYIIQSGFLNIAAGDVFLFTVTPNVVDFGTLFPGSPVEKIVKLTISNGNTNGYSVTGAQSQPLSTSVGATIPDTACDSPSSAICVISQAQKWTQNTSYGLGYRLSGKTVPSDFKDNYFRPFAAVSREEKAVTMMQSKAKKVVDTAVMTLRLNVSSQQPVGLYKNVINFTAIGGI